MQIWNESQFICSTMYIYIYINKYILKYAVNIFNNEKITAMYIYCIFTLSFGGSINILLSHNTKNCMKEYHSNCW